MKAIFLLKQVTVLAGKPLLTFYRTEHTVLAGISNTRTDMNPDSTFTILKGHFICKTPNYAEFPVNLVQLRTNWILKASMAGSTLPCPTVNDSIFYIVWFLVRHFLRLLKLYCQMGG
jgi:hypothetical protein